MCAGLLRRAFRNNTYEGVRIHGMGREELKCNAVVRQNLVDPTRSSDVPQVIPPCSRRVWPSYSYLNPPAMQGEGTHDLKQGGSLQLRASPRGKPSSRGVRASVLKELWAADHSLHYRGGKKLA